MPGYVHWTKNGSHSVGSQPASSSSSTIDTHTFAKMPEEGIIGEDYIDCRGVHCSHYIVNRDLQRQKRANRVQYRLAAIKLSCYDVDYQSDKEKTSRGNGRMVVGIIYLLAAYLV